MSTYEILRSLKFSPKLDRSSFVRWSAIFLQVLKNLHREKYILEKLPELSSYNQNKSESTKVKSSDDQNTSALDEDGNIKAAFFQLVPEEAYYLIEDKNTSKEMWDSLQEYFRPHCQASVDTLLEEFWSFSMEEGTDIDKFTQELIKRQSKIAAVDRSQRPNDLIMKSRLLNHFDNYRDGYYSGAVTVLRNNLSASFSYTVNSLRNTQANYTRQHPNQMISLATGSKFKESPQTPKNKTCAYCHRSGHIREACFKWLDTADGSRWAAKNPEKAAKSRKLKEMLRKKDKGSRKGKNTNPKDISSDDGSKDSSTDGLWMVEQYALSSTAARQHTDVVLDTGATHHIFYDKSFFTSMSPISTSVQTAAGQRLSVSGVGSVEFRVYDFEDHKRYKIIKIDDVWYLPECTKNLISGPQFLAKGFEIHSNIRGLGLYTSDQKLLATAHIKDGLLCLNTSPHSSSSVDSADSSNFLFPESLENATKLIHFRFAHAGPHLLKKLDVSRLKIPIKRTKEALKFKIDPVALRTCDVCNSCKQVEKINKHSSNKVLGLLEVIHSDTWGKCRVAGIFGALYFVTFTDDASRESEVYLLKSTKEVPGKFEH